MRFIKLKILAATKRIGDEKCGDEKDRGRKEWGTKRTGTKRIGGEKSADDKPGTKRSDPPDEVIALRTLRQSFRNSILPL